MSSTICPRFNLEVTANLNPLVRPFDNETEEHFLAIVSMTRSARPLICSGWPGGRFEFGGRRKARCITGISIFGI